MGALSSKSPLCVDDRNAIQPQRLPLGPLGDSAEPASESAQLRGEEAGVGMDGRRQPPPFPPPVTAVGVLSEQPSLAEGPEGEGASRREAQEHPRGRGRHF